MNPFLELSEALQKVEDTIVQIVEMETEVPESTLYGLLDGVMTRDEVRRVLVSAIEKKRLFLRGDIIHSKFSQRLRGSA